MIRWKEPVFKNRRYGKPARLGDRLVTAEVLRDDGGNGWVDLLVWGCEVVSAAPGRNPSDVLLPEKDTETRRRRGTIIRGEPERLAWSDESARAIVASRFLRSLSPAPRVAAAPGDLDDWGDSDGIDSLRSSFNAVARLNEIRLAKPGWKLPGLHD
ncbi:MAG: hypothetical protein ACLQUZ_05120 [Rhizomicrobium sp.]